MAERQLRGAAAPKRDYFAAARQTLNNDRASAGPLRQATSSRQFAAPYSPVLARLDQNSLAKETAGFLARRLGTMEATVNAPRDAALDLIETGRFVGSLVDRDARERLAETTRQGVAYVRDRAENPRRLVADARAATNHLVQSVVPSATPLSPSFLGELRRSRNIGIRQGKLGIEIGTLVGPGLALKAARAPKLLSIAERIARHEAQGLPRDVAMHLATEPYNGIGLHNVPQRVTRALGVPKVIADSPLNVRKPKAPKGEVYEEHFRSDDEADGFSLPHHLSQKGWSGHRVGLKRYSLPKALWRNAPTPLKLTGASGAALTYDTLGQEEEQ